MKIKLLVSRAGYDFSQQAGDVIDVDDAEAGRMIEAGQAEAVEQRKPAQRPTATRPAQRATNRTSKRTAKRETR